MNRLRWRVAVLAGFALFLTTFGPARADSSWLDAAPRSWNTPGASVPVAPKAQSGLLPGQCLTRERAATGPEEAQVALAGWKLEDYWPVARQGNIALVTATDGYDGMCRPWGLQVFAFVDGRFAGTLSPDPMNSRLDGALSGTPTVNADASIEADFTRYAATDPLCCPSLGKTKVLYRIESGAVVPERVGDRGRESQDAASGSNCQFVLGFKSFHDMLPTIVGSCVTNEEHNPIIGQTWQQTAVLDGKGGLLVWRKGDNAIAYTDGYRTWVLGPQGLQSRLNADRFAWERDRLVPDRLKNAVYQLPLSGNQSTSVRFVKGVGDLTPVGRAQLLEDFIVYTDLNGDSAEDAVVVIVTQTGGSGSFYYAVAALNLDGVPTTAGTELLGDRIQLRSISAQGRDITVTMVTQGPNDPFCCPTQQVTRSFVLPK